MSSGVTDGGSTAALGVHVTEEPILDGIVGVATAVPVFIGYTQTAAVGGVSVAFKPVAVNALAGFEQTFGGAPTGAGFNLHRSMQLFYDNGGGECFVVSTGGYDGGVDADKLVQGLAEAGKQVGATITLIPDAVLLPADDAGAKIPISMAYQTLVRAMLAQCVALGDRVALLDVYGAQVLDQHAPTFQADMTACVTNFHAAVGDAGLSYGIAYFPFLVTSYGALPPSGAMAGVITAIDTTQGVWHPPANVALNAVSGPTVPIAQADLESLSLPPDGKAVNCIRAIPSRGPVVWGAHTLDGLSDDWRYVQVRRTIVYIEQSITAALRPYAFMPNTERTWSAVTAMISGFLTPLWTQGGLIGDTASAAFSVRCGLGITMTADDILNGTMSVSIALAMIHPAEFIELTIQQTMQGA